MATVYVIRNINGKEIRIPIAERLAKDAVYMSKHKLKLAPTIPSVEDDASPIVELYFGSSSKLSTIIEDVESMSVDDLQSKYHMDDWVYLAKELKLRGNHSNTRELKLITKIKNKLAE